MLTTIWTFIQPYVSNVFVWVILALVIACGIQTTKCYMKDTEIAILTVKLDAANDKLTVQKAEFEKLKLLADVQDVKLKQAYKDNIEIEKQHAKTVENILKTKLPDTASCDDVAKWAREIAKNKKYKR